MKSRIIEQTQGVNPTVNPPAGPTFLQKAKSYGKLAGAIVLTGEIYIQSKVNISVIGTTARVVHAVGSGAMYIGRAAVNNPHMTALTVATGVAASLFVSASDDWEKASEENISFCKGISLSLKATSKVVASGGVFLGSLYLVGKF